MGIFIHFAMSRSVTQEEWTKAYEESLKLADELQLSEYREMRVHGVTVDCLTKVKERDLPKWPNGTAKGWEANGDYDFLTFCEDNGLRREIGYTPNPDAVDPLLALSRLQKCDKQEEDPWIDDFVEFWGGKTQGEPQHMSLLAIACMFSDRLKDKVLVYGDISRGQCRQATEMANEVLDQPIQEPDICDPERFMERISRFPTDADKFSALDEYYLGEKGASYGEFLRKHFTAETLDAYWADRFSGMPVNTIGYGRIYKEYLVQGFDLGKLCGYSKMTDKDGKDLTETFVKNVMESELYIPEKNCEDKLELNTDQPGTYSIYSLLAQFAFGGARNPRVDRYISLDEIRRTLKEELGGRCDVDGIIDGYLVEKKEKEAAGEKSNNDLFNTMVDQTVATQQKKKEDYKIHNFRALLAYRSGYTVSPGIQKNIVHLHQFFTDLLEKNRAEFQRLSEDDLDGKYHALARRSSALAMRDKDWEKVFTDIEEHPDSYSRYWPAANIQLNDDDIRKMVQAYVLNDDLYRDLTEGKLDMPEDKNEDKNTPDKTDHPGGEQ